MKARAKEVTGLLHISDRLPAGELSRVEAARGNLQPLRYVLKQNRLQIIKAISLVRHNIHICS